MRVFPGTKLSQIEVILPETFIFSPLHRSPIDGELRYGAIVGNQLEVQCGVGVGDGGLAYAGGTSGLEWPRSAAATPASGDLRTVGLRDAAG